MPLDALLRKRSKYDKALEDFDKMIELEPDRSESYFNKGTALAFMGRNEESISYLDNALKIDPEFVNAFINKAEAFGQLNDKEKALEAMNLTH